MLTNATLSQLRTLADNHEFNLAYNNTEPIRAIAGSTLAAQILKAFNTTITGGGNSKLNVQFGAYGSFQSFFGLANLTTLPNTNDSFYGVPDYASTMTFELFTDEGADPFPPPDAIQVRFLFHNGTTSNISEPTVYPLFGQDKTELSWADFENGMNKFAIGGQEQWCQACGNSTGVCASAASTNPTPASSSGSSNGGGGGVSEAVAGVIGAMVTLAVILAVEAAVMLAAGLRLVSKKRLAGGNVDGAVGNGAKA